jgi:tetratricopeptide (TPR) repeat protein
MKSFLVTIMFSVVLITSVFSQENINKLIADGDSLFNAFDNKGALEYYQKAYDLDSTNYEVCWKLSRSYVDVGETLEDDPRAEYYSKGNFYGEKAVMLNPDGAKGHLRLSIAIGRVALDAGAKERVRLSKEVKKEVDLAIKLDPNDDIAYHVLGRWNRKLANLSWIERGFANMFLGGVPADASEENAAANFKKAIEINPGYINHHLELGMTYEMMDMDEEAKAEYQKCLNLPKSSARDDVHKATAKEKLDDLK